MRVTSACEVDDIALTPALRRACPALPLAPVGPLLLGLRAGGLAAVLLPLVEAVAAVGVVPEADLDEAAGVGGLATEDDDHVGGDEPVRQLRGRPGAGAHPEAHGGVAGADDLGVCGEGVVDLEPRHQAAPSVYWLSRVFSRPASCR